MGVFLAGWGGGVFLGGGGGGGVKGDFFDFETCLIDHRSVLDVNCLLSRVRGAGLFFAFRLERREIKRKKDDSFFSYFFRRCGLLVAKPLPELVPH